VSDLEPIDRPAPPESRPPAASVAARSEERVVGQIMTDAQVIGVVGGVATSIVAGSSPLVGAALGVLAGLGLGFAALFLVAMATGSRETLLRKLVGWALALVGGGLALEQLVSPLASLTIAGCGFLYAAARTTYVHLRPARAAALPAPSSEAPRLPATATPVDEDERPPELPGSVQQIVDAAIADHGQLVEALQGDASREETVALRQEAEAMLRAIVREAPRVARVVDLAMRRPDDEAAAEAARAALARFQEHGRSLSAAASAAIRFLASDVAGGADRLAEETERLHLLVEATEELRRDLG
jgi:hypothetical protein